MEKYLGASCPQCHIPAHVKDADVNRQLFNIASLCQKLRDVLSAPAADDVQADQGRFSGTDLCLMFVEKNTCRMPFIFQRQMRLCVRKPAIWVPTRSDTNGPVQSQNKTSDISR